MASGKQIIQDFLDTYGLGSLGEWAWNLYVSSGTDNIQTFVAGQLSVELPKTEAFKARFPAYDTLRQQGRGISVDQYRQYEQDAQNLGRFYGLPEGMLQDRSYLATLMTNGVSTRELEQRLAINREAATNAPPEVRQALTDMYGVANVDGALTAYYLDPEHSLPHLQQQYQTAQIAGAAMQQQIEVSRQQAERLQQQGITWEQAQSGFRTAASVRGLTYGAGDTITQDQAVSGAFGDQQAQSEVTRVQRARQAAFQGSGGAVESKTGVTGLGSTSR